MFLQQEQCSILKWNVWEAGRSVTKSLMLFSCEYLSNQIAGSHYRLPDFNVAAAVAITLL